MLKKFMLKKWQSYWWNKNKDDNLEQISQKKYQSPYFKKTKAESRDFLGTPFFKMVIFPYRHHGCLGVRKLWVFNTSDSL